MEKYDDWLRDKRGKGGKNGKKRGNLNINGEKQTARENLREVLT